MADIAIGRKEIMRLLHVSDWKTVRRWKKSGLPMRYLPNQKPMVIVSELKKWLVTFDELRKNSLP